MKIIQKSKNLQKKKCIVPCYNALVLCRQQLVYLLLQVLAEDYLETQ